MMCRISNVDRICLYTSVLWLSAADNPRNVGCQLYAPHSRTVLQFLLSDDLFPEL